MAAFYDNADEAPDGLISRGITDRQHLARCEIESHLRAESELIYERRAELREPNYSSVELYLASLEPSRARWSRALGTFEGLDSGGDPIYEPFLETPAIHAWWLSCPWRGASRLHAVLAVPAEATGPLPLVVAQHGIGSSPERIFGFDDPQCLYRAFGRRLVEDGYAVLAPLHITGAKPRARLHRMCLMLGGTLWGYEMARLRRLLDIVLARPDIDSDRVGMWGLSLGGAYTLMYGPLEPRLRLGICAGWFNRRVAKMVIDDPRHSCFLSVDEEHIFIPGWLTEFTDAGLAELWCPRPLMIQTGKADGIAWWPWVSVEMGFARHPYQQLGIPERLVWDLHEGGHEVRYETGLEFLRRWL